MKAEALYLMGEFELALMFFHRGQKQRQELSEFRLGIQKSREAIENCIGTPESVKLDTTGDLSFFEKQDSAQGKKPGKTYTKPGAQLAKSKERERPKSSANTKTVKQLLEELYKDKEYLDVLLKDGCLTSMEDNIIKDKVCDGLDYLNGRADWWRQQKPMYARKRDKEKMRRGAKSRIRDPTSFIMNSLEDIEEKQAIGRYEESLTTAKAVMKEVNRLSDDELQNKQEILANVYSQMGNAHLELGQYKKALDCHKKDREIAEDNGLEDARSRALDNLGRVYARKGEYSKAVNLWEEKLPLSKSALESTWLYHEIGRCYLEMEKYDDARDYGEKSIQAAKEAEDDGWQLHATVLVAQAELKARDYQAAQESFERALELARSVDDSAAEAAIKKALENTKEKITKGYQEGEYSDDEDHEATKGKSDTKEKQEEKDDRPASKTSKESKEKEERQASADRTSPKRSITPKSNTSAKGGKGGNEAVTSEQNENVEDNRKASSPTKSSHEEGVKG